MTDAPDPFPPRGFSLPMAEPIPQPALSPSPSYTPPPAELLNVSRNTARWQVGWENAINTINEIHNTFTTGSSPIVKRAARDEPTG